MGAQCADEDQVEESLLEMQVSHVQNKKKKDKKKKKQERSLAAMNEVFDNSWKDSIQEVMSQEEEEGKDGGAAREEQDTMEECTQDARNTDEKVKKKKKKKDKSKGQSALSGNSQSQEEELPLCDGDSQRTNGIPAQSVRRIWMGAVFFSRHWMALKRHAKNLGSSIGKSRSLPRKMNVSCLPGMQSLAR